MCADMIERVSGSYFDINHTPSKIFPHAVYWNEGGARGGGEITMLHEGYGEKDTRMI